MSPSRTKSRRLPVLVAVVAVVAALLAAPAIASAASAADAAGCAPFRQPYAGDAAYAKGDKVTFNGKVYQSTFAPNWWSPSAAPQYWSETTCGTATPTPTPTPTTSNPSSPTPTATPESCPAFRQPYAGDPAYAKGDKVTFDGKVYRSTFAPNWWSPASAPQYWAETTCDGTSTPTPTPTPTSTPTPTVTPTQDPGTPPPTGTPDRLVFSPYKDVAQGTFWSTGYVMGTAAIDGVQRPLVGPGTTLQSSLPALNTLTLAFATGECGSENWAGMTPQGFADQNIPGLDAADYDYILSTGGEAGVFTCSSPAGMRTFIDRYASDNLVGVDFDIEGGQSAAQVRDLATSAAAVQDLYPNLRFSFTIATIAASDGSYGGVNSLGDTVVKAVLASGLRNYTINLMTMYFGAASTANCVPAAGVCDIGASAIQAAKNLRHTYPAVPLSKIELTPLVGRNWMQGELLTLQDIDEMTAYAVQNDLAGLHFWSLDRDYRCGATAPADLDLCNGTPAVPSLGYTKQFLRALGRL
jgi:chitinase